METLKFNVFNFLNKSKKTTLSLGLLCPTFRYMTIQNDNGHCLMLLLNTLDWKT